VLTKDLQVKRRSRRSHGAAQRDGLVRNLASCPSGRLLVTDPNLARTAPVYAPEGTDVACPRRRAGPRVRADGAQVSRRVQEEPISASVTRMPIQNRGSEQRNPAVTRRPPAHPNMIGSRPRITGRPLAKPSGRCNRVDAKRAVAIACLLMSLPRYRRAGSSAHAPARPHQHARPLSHADARPRSVLQRRHFVRRTCGASVPNTRIRPSSRDTHVRALRRVHRCGRARVRIRHQQRPSGGAQVRTVRHVAAAPDSTGIVAFTCRSFVSTSTRLSRSGDVDVAGLVRGQADRLIQRQRRQFAAASIRRSTLSPNWRTKCRPTVLDDAAVAGVGVSTFPSALPRISRGPKSMNGSPPVGHAAGAHSLTFFRPAQP